LQRNLEGVAPLKKINFPPIQNGFDYLMSTVEHLRERPTARDLKYAVLHLQAAVEVLLKVRGATGGLAGCSLSPGLGL
jgi:hypothetical protein